MFKPFVPPPSPLPMFCGSRGRGRYVSSTLQIFITITHFCLPLLPYHLNPPTYTPLSPIHLIAVNWSQLAGDRAQNTATPYLPDQWHRNPRTSVRPMWSARWGHAVVVLNQPSARPYLTEEENSALLRDANPILVLLGGDDGLPSDTSNVTHASEMGIGSGKLRNDVWIGQPTSANSQSSWRVDDRYYIDGETFNPELIRSEMKWYEATPGRVSPATWPSGPKYSLPLTNDEWIACQDSIKDRLDYTLALPDPSICEDPPQFCYEDIHNAGCHEQGVWKRDNMWSPRRGLGAVVANDKLFVIGGQAREYARIKDARLVGGLGHQKRIETVKEHSTIREDLVLKNDVWASRDGEGISWELVNPGCKDPQEDVLLQTEVWSRDQSDPSLPKFVGSMGSRCYRSSDCYGVAECKSLGNTPDKVCVCPMFSPRTNHAVVVQHRYSIQEDESVFAEDVMYVIGGFINVKQAFCANRSCGPSDGYRLAVDDVWMSTDGINWTQIKPAFSSSKDSSFRGRGSHTAVIVHSLSSYSNPGNVTSTNDVKTNKDRLLIFGGETSSPQELSTTYLNDIWQLDLPTEPCCIPSQGCTDTSKVYNHTCLPSQSDWTLITSNAEWPERSGHATVYEAPSSSNSFQPRIYLSGGKNSETVLSDVWTWDLDDDWQCDNDCSELADSNVTSAHDVFLSIDSPLSDVKKFQLPPLDDNGKLINLTNHSSLPIVSDEDISTMALEGVNTIQDLASADLYTVVKLRGFDYPGRHAQEVPNICHLRAISIAIVDKCSIKVSPSSYFHRKGVNMARVGHQNNKSLLTTTLCGRGGETKPCVRGDWDGCTPIPGRSKVDVHGLGDVVVPQILHDTSSVLEEIFCRQVPDGRYNGAGSFLDNKVVILGGIGGNSSTHRLHRDVWARDETFPQAFITTKPLSRSPQSQFYFDSNEAGAHVFEYKLKRDDDSDIIPWTTTTKHLGANIAWLDHKIGGPGRGWYTLYVRAVDPSGNRDTFFSTQTNVYRWYYVPPVPWGYVSGCIIAALVLIAASYYEYRRRKKKRIMQRFQLRRMRRKFKLKNAPQEVHAKFEDEVRRRRGEANATGSNSRHSSSLGKSSSHRRGDRSHSRSHKSRRRGESKEHHPRSPHRTREHRTHRSHSHSRSKSKSRSSSHHDTRHSGLRERRRHRTPEQLAEEEARARRRRDREKLKRDLRQRKTSSL